VAIVSPQDPFETVPLRPFHSFDWFIQKTHLFRKVINIAIFTRESLNHSLNWFSLNHWIIPRIKKHQYTTTAIVLQS